MPPFKWDTKQLSSREDAFQQLYEVVKAYQPGQSEIDGGGFDIVAFDPKAGYMYVQFQSLKNGYIDDFELAAVGDDNTVQVRSSSRLGWVSCHLVCKMNSFLAKCLICLVSPFQVGLWCQCTENQLHCEGIESERMGCTWG